MESLGLDTFLSVVAFLLGTIVGSFLNVCVHRLPRNESVLKPRSKCPKCGHAIAWYDNIPILSWLVLRAKCRHCQAGISWRYPLVEAITGTLFLLVFLRFEYQVATPVYMALSAGLVLVTFVDFDDWTIPNEVTFPGIPIGIACSLVEMFYPESGFYVPGPFVPVFNSLLGALVGGGALYVLDKLSLVLLKKRGMGFGDVKLAAMLGAFFGLGVLLIIMLASVIGSIVGVAMIAVKGRQTEEQEGHYLPFGPYLSLAGLIVMFLGRSIIETYQSYLVTGTL